MSRCKISVYSCAGDEEKQYWDKLTADREAKLGNKSRHKRRGHEKVRFQLSYVMNVNKYFSLMPTMHNENELSPYSRSPYL